MTEDTAVKNEFAQQNEAIQVAGAAIDDLRERSTDPPPEPQGPPPSEPAGLSESQMGMAEALGFSSEEIDTLGPDRVQAILAKHEAQAFNNYIQQAEQYRAEQQQYGSQQPPMPQMPWQQAMQPMGPQLPMPPGQPFVQQGGNMPGWGNQFAPPGTPQQQGPWQLNQQQQPPGPQPISVKLDKNQYDEEIVNAFEQLQQQANSQLLAQQEYLQQLQQLMYHQMYQQEQQQAVENYRWFDRHVSELNDDFKSVYGSGPTDRLPYGSPQAAARQQLWEKFQDYAYWKQSPNLKDEDLWQSFLSTVVGTSSDHQQRQLAQKLQQNSKKTIGRPTRRRTNNEALERNPETGTSQSTVDTVAELLARYSQ